MYHEVINYATKQYPFLIEHKNVKYIPHFHDELEIVFVLEGSLNVTLSSSSFTLKKDEICIITPGLIHNLYSYKNNKTYVMKLFPITDLSKIQLTNMVLSPGDEDYDTLRGYITDIMHENQNKELGYEISVNISAEKIFLTILRNMKYHRLEDKTMTKLESKNDFLNSVTTFLEEHYVDDFTLDEVAGHFNYTKSYFCHYFKRITGVTFWKYYIIFRLEKSLQLMKEYPNKKLIEIASDSGFKNIRSFNQSFKEYYRSTPREYMKKYYM